MVTSPKYADEDTMRGIIDIILGCNFLWRHGWPLASQIVIDVS